MKLVYINLVSLCVCDGGFESGGKERLVKQWAKNQVRSVYNTSSLPILTPDPIDRNSKVLH